MDSVPYIWAFVNKETVDLRKESGYLFIYLMMCMCTYISESAGMDMDVCVWVPESDPVEQSDRCL